MDRKEVFKEFLEKNDILIVDKNASSRTRLVKILHDLGAKHHQIHAVSGFAEAAEYIATRNIGLILSEYFIGGGSGFDLFRILKSKSSVFRKDICNILVTSNLTQSAVAKAAEEDVDSFIIKPYTVQSIQENLITTVTDKIRPSQYVKSVDQAKDFLIAGDYQSAITILQDSIKLHTKPSLALFYIGQAEYMKNSIRDAKNSYASGLNYNSIHFKCLIGMYELLMRDGQYHDAYQVVRTVASTFPANPSRLSEIVRLAVRTENFPDMKDYYKIFTDLEDRPMELKNYIGAGLYVSGKHHLKNDNIEEALKLFECVAISCSEFSKFTRAIVTVLVEHGKVKEAESYLTRFTSEDRMNTDYKISEYLVYSLTIKDPKFLVKMGLDLFNDGIRDDQCLQVLIQAMKNSGYQEDKILPFREEIAHLKAA